MSVLIDVQRLEDENEVIKIQRHDKEEVLFYNNSEYEICVDEGAYTHLLSNEFFHLFHDMLYYLIAQTSFYYPPPSNRQT